MKIMENQSMKKSIIITTIALFALLSACTRQVGWVGMNYDNTFSATYQLFDGKQVQLPKFDFLRGKRYMNGDNLKLQKGDILIVEDLRELNLDYVLSKGEIVAQNREYFKPTLQIKYPDFMKTQINLKKE